MYSFLFLETQISSFSSMIAERVNMVVADRVVMKSAIRVDANFDSPAHVCPSVALSVSLSLSLGVCVCVSL